MRELFQSEKRYIRNILLQNGRAEWNAARPVVGEYYAPPRVTTRPPYFNLDYVLRFVEPDAMTEHRSMCARVLPETMGAEVFLTVDVLSGEPVMTELDSGEAFPLGHFKTYADIVEAELARLNAPARFQASQYCRMFVIECDVCFLLFPDATMPEIRGESVVLRDDADALLIAFFDTDRMVCVDGWIRADLPPGRGNVLVAT